MKFPGAQYADIDAHGRAHVAPAGFPTDGLCRQMRCSRSGLRFAGIGQGDIVFEWVDGAWHDRGPCWGPRAVIYRGEELLIIRPPGPANGYRYIAPDGTPVLAVPDTYAHPTLPIWEYTTLPNGLIVGQGGAGPHGEDPLIIVQKDSDGRMVRRLVQGGMCRFINAYLSPDGGSVLLAWQQDGIGSDARVVPVSAIDSLPDADAGQPVPVDPIKPPIDPVKPEEPKMRWKPEMPDRTDIVQQVKDEHPDEWQAANIPGGHDARYIRRLAWRLHSTVDKRFGLNGKRGNPNDLSLDCVAFQNPTVDNGPEVADVIVSHESPQARPGWQNITRDSQGWNSDGTQERDDSGAIVPGGGAVWVKPEPVAGDPVKPVDPVDPVKPTDPSDLASLRAELSDLRAALARTEKRLSSVEQAKQSGGLHGKRVAFRASHGKYVAFEPGGRVVADRDAVGGWEVVTAEEQ